MSWLDYIRKTGLPNDPERVETAIWEARVADVFGVPMPAEQPVQEIEYAEDDVLGLLVTR